MGGGILVTRDDHLASGITHELQSVPRPSAIKTVAAAATSLVYAGLLAPSRYWLVERLPWLELGVSRFEPDFPITRLSTYQRTLAAHMLTRMAAYNSIRRRHAERLRSGIDGVEGIEIPRTMPGSKPVYQRFPLLTRDSRHRAGLLARLRAAGIGASGSYPAAVNDIPGIARYLAPRQEPCPGARSIATRIITLPTHPAVISGDVERMVAAVRGLM
jgi:hypothetical protein